MYIGEKISCLSCFGAGEADGRGLVYDTWRTLIALRRVTVSGGRASASLSIAVAPLPRCDASKNYVVRAIPDDGIGLTMRLLASGFVWSGGGYRTGPSFTPYPLKVKADCFNIVRAPRLIWSVHGCLRPETSPCNLPSGMVEVLAGMSTGPLGWHGPRARCRQHWVRGVGCTCSDAQGRRTVRQSGAFTVSC